LGLRETFRRRRGPLAFLAVVGPGLIAGVAGNDAGGITTYATLGSQTGLRFLWILPLTALLLALVQESVARLGVVTGQGLSDLIRERYTGIRPAPGYPACPEHSLKAQLFALMDVPARTGISLTESFAMLPTASVSGFYFAHPQASYFGVARIGRDQLADYAARRGVSLEQAETWLRPNLD
jgi:hypothetical protein